MKTRFPSTREIIAVIFSLAACSLAVADNITFYPVGQLPGGSPNSQIRDAVLTETKAFSPPGTRPRIQIARTPRVPETRP